jgi:hypothetical protein
MTVAKFRACVLLTLTSLVLVVLAGCAREPTPRAGQKNTNATPVAQNKGHDHGGWWCDEHGVPEDECSMCSAKEAAKCKKRGDWCEKHDRAKSQCFLCDPSLEARYAARYEAKYGKKPPVPEENRPRGEDKK